MLRIFDTSGFPARWHCGNWSSIHGWVHILSDIAIFGAYFAIALVLVYFVRRRNDMPFLRIFWLFAAFILSCGISHAIDASLFWQPWYRLSGLVKFITAIISWATVVALVLQLPQALVLPGLARINEQLKREIAERGCAEDALHATQARLNSTLAAGSIGTWTWDIVNDRLTADEFTAHMFSIEPDAAAKGLSAQSYLQALHEEDRPRVAEALDRAIQSCRHYDIEYRVRQKAGECRWLQARGRVESDSAGNALSFHGAVMDITLRKEAEQEVRRLNGELEQRVIERTAQLEAANKELEAFSYSVSHDLRAPLRAIDGFSRIVLKEFAPTMTPDAREYLQDIRANTQKMGQLVDDLLAFSRLSRQPVKKETVAPAKLVRQCLAELRDEQEGRRIEMHVEDLPECAGDTALLKQVWFNLLANALKYTSKRAVATIDVGSYRDKRTGERVYCVKDNGVGFDMDYAHKLFGVFQRLHRAEDYDGTGVGLAIVQRIVHRHGGRVWAEAQVDRGASFFFTLAGGDPIHD